MNWNISAWAIRNPVFPILMFVVLMALGYVSFMGLPITRFPNIDVPVVAVTITDNGSAPAELETQITKRVEDTVAGITGVKNVTSTITDGQSTTAIEFRLEVDTDRAVNDVKDAIAKVRGDLPRTIDEPIIQRIDVENQAIVTYGVASPGKTLEELSWYVDDTAVRAIQGLKGVGRVERIGGVEREIHVSLDPDRLMALGITAAAVNEQLRATNVDLSGGRGEVGGQEQAIRTLAGARSVADLADTRITLPGGREVRLHELGTVSDAWEEPRSFARLNGEPVVSFSVYRAKGASDATVADLVAAKVAELGAADPNVDFSLIDNSVAYTYGNYESAMHTLIEGALLAVIVVFIFLRDFRATIIAAVAMPLAAIPTFWAMSMMGFSLNLVSLLAITLVTGILVDDAIVEIENIVRHIRMGKKPYKAAIEAADEIGLAVIAITLTIMAVFAPVSFMGGVAGQYFKQFGLTVAVAVFFSLLVARLITPMMAAYFLRDHGHAEEKDGLIMRGYTGFLRGTLRFRWITLVAGIGLFATSIWSMQFLPTGFIPAEDASRIVASVELPPGASLDDTVKTTDDIKATIADLPEVASVFVMGGTSPTGTLEVRRAAVIINLTRKGERERSQQVMEDVIAARFAAIPDIRWSYVNDRGERELSVGLMSRDGEALSDAVAALESDMRRDPMFSNPSAAAALDRPEIRVIPDLDKAADLGVSPEAISQTVSVATVGAQGSSLAKFTVGDRQIPIRVELERMHRADLAVIENLRVPTDRGTTVPLASVAEVRFGQGPSSINRFNRERRVVVGSDMAPGFEIGQGLERIKELPAAVNLPAGVRIQEAGDAEIMGEVFAGFAAAMGAGIMMVLVVLILLFASVFQPLTILASLPLSVGGVVVALLVTQNAVSMPVVIGILMLMGIVTKNAIMLVDFAVEEERKGVPQFDAIVDAGRKRARPIIMTTLAMTAGMVPAALATGEGGEFRAPMAIAVIGGLLVSTVLSLIFIPTVYTLMDDLGRLVARIFAWAFRPNAPEEEEPVTASVHGGAVAVHDPRVTHLPVRPAVVTPPAPMREAAE
ncbi:efflux RND transporter permease subunit [Mongoliimonas terrestris]|uniref:efflux RND transporter permease subunit n=1 Tax=Mongoliimonas terrestris TaxID=1709001 RepID=UPI0009497DAC|nr:efflux RND transporter permease subunit [Mongoliimonas terrestris]